MHLVHRIRMRLKLRELRRRARMTLLARRQNVRGRKMRGRIGRRQHIMVTVAVITGRHFRRHIRLAQRHRLPVIRLPVMFQPVLMALAAALVAKLFEMAAVRRLDLMRTVAVRADRPPAVALHQQLPVHALIIDALHLHMALPAGLGHVDMVNGRIPVHIAFDRMRTMAVVARRRHDQPHLQQRPPVDAVHVLRGRLRKFNLVFLGKIRVAVAFRARGRQVQLVHRALGILHRQNFVRTVAVPALRRARGPHRMAHPVDARLVELLFLVMAPAAVRRRNLGMHQLLDPVMAVHAIQRAMHRRRKTVRGKQRQRGRMAVHHPLVGRIGMAIETIRTGKFGRRIGRRGSRRSRRHASDKHCRQN